MIGGAALQSEQVPAGERAARMAWARLVEPKDAEAVSLISRVGAEEALFSLDPGSKLGRRLAPRLEVLDVRRDLHVAAKLGARVLVPGDDEWPTGLDDLATRPFCLWVRGPLHLREACERSASVVGARAATHYGTRQSSEIAAGLAERRFTVVSGAAYGIDGAAHRGALAAEGATVVFTAGGVDRPYPRGHDDLFARIAAAGLVVSEVPPGCAPTSWRFLSRNRLIATVSQGTVVVEAGLRSGSLNTAKTALDHHRLVGAVPGSVESAVSAGCHQWIREGRATLVTDAAEVAELVGPMGELAPTKRGQQRPDDDLEPRQRLVLAALPVRRAVTTADVAKACAQVPADVLGALAVMQVRGLVTRDEEGRWRKVTAARSTG